MSRRKVASVRRTRRASINPVVDEALREPGDASRVALLRLRQRVGTGALAERVRQRAALLARRLRTDSRAIHAQRDALVEAIYIAATPPGWCGAWSDGASRDGEHAGLGGILLDHDGRRLATIAHSLEPMTALAAESAAFEAVLRLARDHGVQRLRLHTDCHALADRWRSGRESALANARLLAQGFDGFELRIVPRLHNQPANALARGATRVGSGPI